jgi:hypothetical protein
MKETRNLWTLLVILSILIVGVFTSVNFGDVDASPDTTFAVEYEYSWPPTGPNFKVNVTVYDASYLYSWQINMTWNPAVLQYTGLTFGGFLTTQPEGSTTGKYPTTPTNFVLFYETTKGSHQGKSAAKGLLATITFTVLVPGHTVMDISGLGGPIQMTKYVYCITPPQLVTMYPITQNGYMCTLKGDTDFDGDVDYTDFLAFCAEYLKTSGSVGWTGKADFDHDGDVDYTDFLAFTSNYLKTV